jgi:dolichol-phosphate mannosyltransferase
MSRKSLLEGYLKFCVVGASGVIVDMMVLHFMAGLGQTPSWVSMCKIVAAESAILSNYLLNDFWTFRDVNASSISGAHRGRRFLRFNLICATGIVISVAILNALVFAVGVNLYLANLLAIAVVSVWNYFLSQRFAWKRKG